MAEKYTNEFKLKMINEYLKSEKSIYKFTKENNLPSATFHRWLKNYEEHCETSNPNIVKYNKKSS